MRRRCSRYREDYISVARTDQTPGSYVNYTYTREGNPLKVRAPSDPGTYEVRYILGRGEKYWPRRSSPSSDGQALAE